MVMGPARCGRRSARISPRTRGSRSSAPASRAKVATASPWPSSRADDVERDLVVAVAVLDRRHRELVGECLEAALRGDLIVAIHVIARRREHLIERDRCARGWHLKRGPQTWFGALSAPGHGDRK